MSEVKGVDVNIMGRELRVSCTDDERDNLLASVSYLDKKMREIRETGRVIGVERIAIMAALNFAHELLIVRNGNADFSGYKNRIHHMQQEIDAVLAEQNQLF